MAHTAMFYFESETTITTTPIITIMIMIRITTIRSIITTTARTIVIMKVRFAKAAAACAEFDRQPSAA